MSKQEKQAKQTQDQKSKTMSSESVIVVTLATGKVLGVYGCAAALREDGHGRLAMLVESGLERGHAGPFDMRVMRLRTALEKILENP